MILLYTLFVFCLMVVGFLVRRRVSGLERQYTRAAVEADKVLRQPVYKAGNTRVADPCQEAKRQYALGKLVEKRDRVEARYTRWQAKHERWAKFVAWARSWKGRKMPYTFGALDVYGAFALADWLGVRDVVSAQALTDFVTNLFVR